MFLKNYTSDVPVTQTIHRIRQVLIKCGAASISEDYSTAGEIISLRFSIETPTGTIGIRLPADTEKALDALWLDYVGDDKLNDKGDAIYWNCRKKKRRADFRQQAERTAWKIIQDWVEVQMSMIQLKQAEVMQVFLPYVFNGKVDYFTALKESGFAGLLPERTQ
jgi:hypothetical protein